jgi:MoaA/NifB/PqqE/SkfB family radical SAM enzyme
MKLKWSDLFAPFRPRTGWIQVEVTSHCNAACVYCPHTVYRENWQSRHLPLAAFQTLLPTLARKSLAYLQGWGEPLLHPDFFSMAALAKKAGCRVGATTNCMLLDERLIQQILAVDLDILAFSLAGVDESQDEIRRGTSFQGVLDHLKALSQAKARAGRSRPQINVAYLVLKSKVAELKRLPQVLSGLGIEEVVLQTLDFVPTRELAAEAFHGADPAEQVELVESLETLAAAGGRKGLKIACQPLRFRERNLLCPENVQQSLCVAADGAVSPCVFTNLPISAGTYWAQGRVRPYRPLTFGNIHDQSVQSIWRQPAYQNFRRSFFTGKLATPCQHCLKLQD